MAALSSQTYSPTEEAEIQQWLTTSERLETAADDRASILDTLNSHLASRTTLLGSKPSKADVAIYEALAPLVAAWTPEERTGERGRPHIVRHVDFVQNAPQFGHGVEDAQKVKVDQDDVRYVKPPVDAKAEKERLKKEKAAAAAAAASAAGNNGGGEKAASLVDRTKEKVKEVADEAKGAAAAAVGADKPKKEKKEKIGRAHV